MVFLILYHPRINGMLDPPFEVIIKLYNLVKNKVKRKYFPKIVIMESEKFYLDL